MADSSTVEVQVRPHHEQRRICASRAKYREGRRPRAVKVYTINLESRYLLVQGVPAVGVMKELIEQFALYGAIEEYNALDEYPAEEFTEVYLIKYQRLQSARVAKQKLDEQSFFGGLLHVCYAPEFETVQETREKLQDRRKFVARVTSNKDQTVLCQKREVRISAKTSAHGLHESHLTTANTSISGYPLNNSDVLESCWTPPLAAEPVFSKGIYCSSLAISDESSKETLQETIYKMPVPSSMGQVWQNTRPNKPGDCVARFMPRTTQLQERQRKREHDIALSLCGATANTQTVNGPKLPELPKLDMDDDSLNITAGVIRGKLKQVSCMPANTSDGTPAKPPAKQRRRI